METRESSGRKLLAVSFEDVVYPQNPARLPLTEPPRAGSLDFLMKAREHFDVMLVSEHAYNFVLHRWLKRWGWPLIDRTGQPEGIQLESRPPRHPHMYIARRVLRFTGEWPSLIELTKELPYLDERQPGPHAVGSPQEHPT